MSRKSKGINAERELIHLFWAKRVACLRVAGSGSSHYPSPDIIASNGTKTLAIECKCSKGDYQYLSHEEVEDLEKFSMIFGAEAWIGVRFSKEDWKFFKPNEIKKTEKNYVITRKSIGKNLDGLIYL